MTRVKEMTLAGLALISLIFLGSFALLYQISNLNYVNPFLLIIVGFSTAFGLTFGLFAGRQFTKHQLKSLTTKGEWLGKESKEFLFATIAGLLGFMLVSFIGILFVANSIRGFFAVGEFFFVISATFTLYVERMILVGLWERQTKTTIWADWNYFFGRLYISPD